MATEDNQQILSSDRLDNLRREFEGKVEKLDNKIGEKISCQLFYWIIAGLFLIGGACIAFVIDQNNQEANKLDKINDRLTVIETLIEERKNNQTP